MQARFRICIRRQRIRYRIQTTDNAGDVVLRTHRGPRALDGECRVTGVVFSHHLCHVACAM
jgi:hypothetical protein